MPPDPLPWPDHLPREVLGALRNAEAPAHFAAERFGPLGSAARECRACLARLARALHSLPWVDPGVEADIDLAVEWPDDIGATNLGPLQQLERAARLAQHGPTLATLPPAAEAVRRLSLALEDTCDCSR